MLTATGAFAALILISAAAFSPSDYSIPSYKQSDKALHFVAFFLLTVAFYWILETSRRKVLQFTLLVCTLGLGVASEVVQGLLPVWLPRGGTSSIWT
jgi:VanZ family protein